MKANQKGEHSPYDFARRSASRGTEPLRYKVTRGYFFPRPVKYGNFSGRSDIENCPFHSRSTVFRYGTSKQQHGNGTYGNQDNSTIRGVTERGGQLQQTNHKLRQSGYQDSAEATLLPPHFCFTAIDRTQLPSNFSSPRPHLREIPRPQRTDPPALVLILLAIQV